MPLKRALAMYDLFCDNGSFLACFCLVRGLSRTVNSPVYMVSTSTMGPFLFIVFFNF